MYVAVFDSMCGYKCGVHINVCIILCANVNVKPAPQGQVKKGRKAINKPPSTKKADRSADGTPVACYLHVCSAFSACMCVYMRAHVCEWVCLYVNCAAPSSLHDRETALTRAPEAAEQGDRNPGGML